MSGTVLSTVYTYGAGKVLFYVLNAIAMLFNGGFMASFMNLMLMLALLWAGIKAGISRDSHREYSRWFLSYLFVLLVLIQPPSLFKNGGMTIHIRDVVTNKAYKVDNLPPGLVLPASFISGLGFSMTKAFETVFSDVDTNYLPYHKYGTMFGAQVMSEFHNFTIQDPVFAENIESYISNCIAYDVMIGKKYDIFELERTTNVWELIKENASSLRMFNYRNANKGGRELLTCKAGIPKLEQYFTKEHELLSIRFPIFSRLSSVNANHGIINAIKLSTDFYGNNGISATEQLKQILISNAFKNVPASYGKVKVVPNQNSNWSLTGELAKDTVPIIHAIFQAIIYSVFPITVALLFFSQRFQMLKTYFEMMFWIELWPILFAVLNLAVSVFSKEAGTVTDITIGNINHIASVQSSYAMCAASLTLMVPIISYMLAKGGVSSFVHMAGSLLGSSAAGVGVAVHEVTSGNPNLDNRNIANRSYNNTSANKLDTTGIIASGHMKQTLLDGTIQADHLFKDSNSQRLQGGAGLRGSIGNTAINSSQAIQESLGKDLQFSTSNHASASQEFASMQQSTERQAIEYVARIAQGQSEGQHYDFKHNTSETQQFNEILKSTKDMHENYGYDWSQAATSAVRAGLGAEVGANASFGGKMINKGMDYVVNQITENQDWRDGEENSSGMKLGVSGNSGLSYEGSNSSTNHQYIEERQTAGTDRSNSSAIELVVSASQDMNYSASNSEEKSMAENLSFSYEQLTQKRESLAYYQNQLEQAQETYQKFTGVAMHMDKNAYDEVLYHISQKLEPHSNSRIGLNKAREIIEEGGSKFQGYFDSYIKSKIPDMRIPQTNHFE